VICRFPYAGMNEDLVKLFTKLFIVFFVFFCYIYRISLLDYKIIHLVKMDDKLYVSEKPIYKYIFRIGVEPQGFKNGSQCKIIKQKFVFNEDENFKSYVNGKDTGNFIDAIFIKSEDSYTGEGHSNSVYTVKIIDSNGI